MPEPVPSPTATAGSGGDAFEADDTTNTAKTIPNGDTQSRTLHNSTDIDWVKFNVDQAGWFYTFIVTTSSTNLDLAVYSADNLSVSISDGTANSDFETQITTEGTYYLKIHSPYGQKGSYTLLFTKDPLTISIRRKLGLLK